jgi:diguanylate cyclase (GGDEF)-like protein
VTLPKQVVMFITEHAVIPLCNRLWQRIDPGSFGAPGAICRFAFAIAFRSVIVTNLAAFACLVLLYSVGILSLPFDQMVRLTVGFSWLFGIALSGSLAVVAGTVIRDLARARAEFEHLSRTDSLTGLANRRAFNDALTRVEGQGSLAIIDIDRFKRVNDRFGHQAGDDAIRTIASVLCRVFGEGPFVARLGGEEFGVILQRGSLEERLAVFEQVRAAVAQETWACVDRTVSVTISVGVAEFQPGRRAEGVYAAADRALYLAKGQGRDQVVHERHLPVDWRPSDDAAGVPSLSRVSMPRG